MSTPSVDPLRRILVIDDTPEIHDDFRKVLLPPPSSGSLAAAKSALFGTAAPAGISSRPRFAADSARQGEEGVAMAQAARESGTPYHVAFVDMRMPPGWDGVQTIEQLWQVDPDVQVVICTAYSDHTLEQLSERLRRFRPAAGAEEALRELGDPAARGHAEREMDHGAPRRATHGRSRARYAP